MRFKSTTHYVSRKVLGSGCYRIGASVEFDWGSVSAVRICSGRAGHMLDQALRQSWLMQDLA